MKKQLSLIFFLALSPIAFAQEYKSEIKKDFLAYMDLVSKADFDNMIAYVPAKYFEIVPKSEVKEKIEKNKDNDYFDYHLRLPEILKIENAEFIDGKYYSLISHRQRLDLKMKNVENPDPSSTRFKAIKLLLNRKFGEEKVSFNKKTGFFEILVEKQACSISGNGKTNWKFVDFDEEQEELLEQLLPEKLTDRL